MIKKWDASESRTLRIIHGRYFFDNDVPKTGIIPLSLLQIVLSGKAFDHEN